MDIESRLPDGFIEAIMRLPGLDADAFLSAMSEAPAVSVKLNRRKCGDVSLLGYGRLEHVSWCPSGYYLEERPKFTLNPLLHGGAFYVQDASSMIHETLVERILPMLGQEEAPAVLDLCAAPGGKTTSMINALPDGSLVMANELMPQRARILVENLLKWGYPDILVSSSPVNRIAGMGEAFDIVAVDAPCSGEGMMRKEEAARTQWGPGLIAQCAALQREILDSAVRLLRPGGFLIYSTCTFNTVENEENLRYLTEVHGLDPVDLHLPEEWGIGGQLVGDARALRFMPHLTRGEGLFAAVVRKPGDSNPVSKERIRKMAAKKAHLLMDSFPTTVIKGRDEAPAPEWPLSVDFPTDRYPVCELDLETALRYLRHEALLLPSETPRGYVALSYKRVRLGLVKNLGTRANNLYPPQWRIRNL